MEKIFNLARTHEAGVRLYASEKNNVVEPSLQKTK
jgi:hypothetical protein